jgi:hypothetical protein
VCRDDGNWYSAGLCDLVNICDIDMIWETPTSNFEIMRKALQDRAQLLPYLYTAVRQAYDTGLSLMRPMYYEYPQEDMAYAANAAGEFAQVRSRGVSKPRCHSASCLRVGFGGTCV